MGFAIKKRPPIKERNIRVQKAINEGWNFLDHYNKRKGIKIMYGKSAKKGGLFTGVQKDLNAVLDVIDKFNAPKIDNLDLNFNF